MAGPAPDPVAVLRGHHAEVQALDFLDAQHVLFTGDAEGEVQAWGLQNLRPIATRRAHPVAGGVLCLQAFSWLGSTFLVTQGKDMSVYIWQLGPDLQFPGEPLHSIHSTASTFCRLSLLPFPNSQEAGSGSRGGSWEGPAGCEALGSSASSKEGLGTTQPGPAAASNSPPGGSGAEAVRVPEACEPGLTGNQPLGQVAAAGDSLFRAQPYPLPHECTAAVADGPPAPLLVLPADDNSCAEVWCCGCGRRLTSLGGRSVGGQQLGMLTSLKLFRLPSGQVCMAAGYEAGWVAVWGLPAAAKAGGASSSGYGSGSSKDGAEGGAGVQPLVARQLHSEPVLAMDVDAGRAGGVSAGADARLVLFKLAWPLDLAGGPSGDGSTTSQSIAEEQAKGMGPAAPGGGTWTESLVSQIKVRKVVQLRTAGVNDVAIRGDGRIVATAGWDGRVRVFKYRTGEPLAVLKYHQAAVASVRISPGTQLLASASRDGTVALWSIYRTQQGS